MNSRGNPWRPAGRRGQSPAAVQDIGDPLDDPVATGLGAPAGAVDGDYEQVGPSAILLQVTHRGHARRPDPIVPSLAALTGGVDPSTELLHDFIVEAEKAVLQVGETAIEVRPANLSPLADGDYVDRPEAMAGDHLDHRGCDSLPRRIAASARTAHIVLAQLPALGLLRAPAITPPPGPDPPPRRAPPRPPRRKASRSPAASRAAAP